MAILRYDPSRTTTLRRRFVADVDRRFRQFARAIKELVVDDDAFGLTAELNPLQLHQQVPYQSYRFLTDTQKIAAFRSWVTQQVNAGLLQTDAVNGKPWMATYIESAQKRGRIRAYIDSRPPGMSTEEYYRGGLDQFLRSAFLQPEMMSKIELLYTRAFENMRGVTDQMQSQLRRILVDGLIQGSGPEVIARRMTDQIGTTLGEGIGMSSRNRARMIARTEIIHAHAEGQLDGFEMLGVEELKIEAEWSTAGDDRVCPDCEGYEGRTFTIDEARGLIPLHPNCRCTWLPVTRKTIT